MLRRCANESSVDRGVQDDPPGAVRYLEVNHRVAHRDRVEARLEVHEIEEMRPGVEHPEASTSHRVPADAADVGNADGERFGTGGTRGEARARHDTVAHHEIGVERPALDTLGRAAGRSVLSNDGGPFLEVDADPRTEVGIELREQRTVQRAEGQCRRCLRGAARRWHRVTIAENEVEHEGRRRTRWVD